MPDLVVDNRVSLGTGAVTWAELGARAESRGLSAAAGSAHAPLAIVVSEPEAAFEAVAWMARHDADALLVGSERFCDRTGALLTGCGYSVLEYPGETNPSGPGRPEPGHGRIGLLTSGSTGDPKLVHHTWSTLFSGERTDRSHPRRWLVPYQVGTYAWYQLVTMGLFQPGQALVPLPSPRGAEFVETILNFGVDSVSSTPTLWRLVFLEANEAQLRALQLRQISLGGEIVDQPLLDRLRGLFPDAQIVHIYASSEAGACIVVRDGKAGFPVDMLRKDDSAEIALKVEEGHLWVRSRYSVCAVDGRPEAWLDTGDLVEVRGRRVIFLGRADSRFISVGGAKLFTGEIEAVVLQHPAVSWCRVRGVRAPVVGSLPEADVVLNPGLPPPSDAELAAHCSARLPEPGVPRFWNRLESIPVQPSLKSER